VETCLSNEVTRRPSTLCHALFESEQGRSKRAGKAARSCQPEHRHDLHRAGYGGFGGEDGES
jgi:hypothetical protein